MERILLESALRSTLIAASVGAGLSLLGIRGAAARHRAWTAVLLVMFALPVWTAWGPRFTLKVSNPVPPYLGSRQSRASAVTMRVERPASPVENAPSFSGFLPLDWPTALAMVYLSGVTILLARLGIGGLKARALVRGATLRDGQWSSARCVGPLAAGWLRPAIVLPDDWPTWPTTKLNAVLTHEFEHLRRRDPLIRSLALLNRAVFWFNPLAWWIERRLAALAEEACDAVVLDRGHDPRDYANYLMEIARRLAHAGGAVHRGGLAMADGPLTNRVRCILEGIPVSPASRTRVAIMALVCAMSSTLFGAGLMEQSQTPSPRQARARASATAAQERELTPAAAASTGAAAATPLPAGKEPPPELIEESLLKLEDAIALLRTLPLESVPSLPLCDSFKLRVAPAPEVDWAMSIPRFPSSPRAQTGDDPMVVVPCQENALEAPLAAVWGTRDTTVVRRFEQTIPLRKPTGQSARFRLEKPSVVESLTEAAPHPSAPAPATTPPCTTPQRALQPQPLSCRYADAP